MLVMSCYTSVGARMGLMRRRLERFARCKQLRNRERCGVLGFGVLGFGVLGFSVLGLSVLGFGLGFTSFDGKFLYYE
jgi:hypothetical protein